jgi:hypothetical protein
MVAAPERCGVALSIQLVRPELGDCVDPLYQFGAQCEGGCRRGLGAHVGLEWKVGTHQD